MDDNRNGQIKASKEILQAMDYIEFKLDSQYLFIDAAKIETVVQKMEVFLLI